MAKTIERSGARLTVVQALYEMEISDKGVIEALAEFEAYWIGRDVDGVEQPPAEISFFRDLLRGVVEEQRAIDPQLDKALSSGLAAEAHRSSFARYPARWGLRTHVPQGCASSRCDLGVCRRRP